MLTSLFWEKICGGGGDLPSKDLKKAAGEGQNHSNLQA